MPIHFPESGGLAEGDATCVDAKDGKARCEIARMRCHEKRKEVNRMPQQDRTGPAGQGPRTGQGQGRCGKTKNGQGAGGVGRSAGKKGGGSGTGRGSRKGCGRGNGQGRRGS